ncbi:glutathione transferase [Pseudomonas sp. DTU_2021_1001937_2_SI_NGA_ILE_001]|uniref:glutathione transferase n=1 Tax=Pseudomonas sp. DTU_2021_1001937_2_SI_NGA_ILE_001 TaxID=3077589 RepID=UPI0028FC15FF|nr:glutathione transferase [Pseudomonas sp. DTU_2021_1001937_2_SI_NGA_ILE_001]WNW10699.1 glutathione transferase [Pseudomonas sp. DTU_2021_1001937_2_SI_NGA_ILE_001]
MHPEPLRLYVDARFVSPYALSAFVALCEKGLAFETVQVDLNNAAQHQAHYAGLSLTHRVPTLVQGDFALSESSAITEYLDESFPGQRLYPQAVQARAKARQVQAWLRSDLLPIRSERNTLVVFCGHQVAAPLSADAQRAADKLFKAALALLPDDREYLFGEWSIADVELAVMLNRLVLNGDPVPARLADYAAHQWQRPSVQQWLDLPRA